MNKGVFAAVVVLAVAVIAGALFWPWQDANPGADAPSTGGAGSTKSTKNNAASQSSRPDTGKNTGQTASSETPKPNSAKATTSEPGAPTAPEPHEKKQAAARRSPAETYCGPDHDKHKTQGLAKAGGLVGIFQHESALSDAYGCATTYLANGGNIDAADPGADTGHLTPLLFAIKRNDPKMVHFMINHGAHLKKRGGQKDMKPYGYAVYSALHNRSTNYNQVIGILDSALSKSAGSSASNP